MGACFEIKAVATIPKCEKPVGLPSLCESWQSRPGSPVTVAVQGVQNLVVSAPIHGPSFRGWCSGHLCHRVPLCTSRCLRPPCAWATFGRWKTPLRKGARPLPRPEENSPHPASSGPCLAEPPQECTFQSMLTSSCYAPPAPPTRLSSRNPCTCRCSPIFPS